MEEKVIFQLTFNPGLVITGFRTILYCLTRHEPAIQSKNQHLASGQLKKHSTSMCCKLEPAIWSCGTGQQVPCFDSCQLIITWMPNIKEVHSKPWLHLSVNPLFGVWPPCCATLSSSPSCIRAHEQYR